MYPMPETAVAIRDIHTNAAKASNGTVYTQLGALLGQMVMSALRLAITQAAESTATFPSKAGLEAFEL